MKASLYTQVIIWVDTILNHIDTRAILPRDEGSCIVYLDPNGDETKLLSHTHTLLVSIKVNPHY